MRKLIGTVTAHTAIRFGALGTHNINVVDNRVNIASEAADTANYLSVKHRRGIFYDKLSYWRDGEDCVEVTKRSCKPIAVTHTKLDGTKYHFV